jgi:hypothetical protein
VPTSPSRAPRVSSPPLTRSTLAYPPTPESQLLPLTPPVSYLLVSRSEANVSLQVFLHLLCFGLRTTVSCSAGVHCLSVAEKKNRNVDACRLIEFPFLRVLLLFLDVLMVSHTIDHTISDRLLTSKRLHLPTVSTCPGLSFGKRKVELLMDLGNGGSLDRRQLLSAPTCRLMSSTHMVNQLLSPILDLIVRMKQMNMFLYDPPRILPSVPSATSLGI